MGNLCFRACFQEIFGETVIGGLTLEARVCSPDPTFQEKMDAAWDGDWTDQWIQNSSVYII
jgi:hypothetical protein